MALTSRLFALLGFSVSTTTSSSIPLGITEDLTRARRLERRTQEAVAVAGPESFSGDVGREFYPAFCNIVGSVISPLLMNIALHGMEEALGVRYDKRGQIIGSRALVRYADDWVVFCESKEDAQVAHRQAQEWLLKRGLRLSEEKTRVVHLSEGFDFLGFNVRHYPAPSTARSGYKLLIKPSKESVRKFKERVRREWMALKGQTVMAVLKRLNPIVRGWTNYFRIGVSKHTFESLDRWMFDRCVRYVRSNHGRKGWRWCRSKYWGQLNPERADRWVFGDKSTGAYLLKLSWTPIKRHVLVKGASSPDIL